MPGDLGLGKAWGDVLRAVDVPGIEFEYDGLLGDAVSKPRAASTESAAGVRRESAAGAFRATASATLTIPATKNNNQTHSVG